MKIEILGILVIEEDNIGIFKSLCIRYLESFLHRHRMD
jgi:hypothetical protein